MPTLRNVSVPFLLSLAVFLGACSSQRAREPYRYTYEPGRTARLAADGTAVAPPRAPAAVKRAIAAGNEICRHPYKYGGGHKHLQDSGYDCSGSTGYVLNRAGLLRGSMPSQGFRRYGKSGSGDWVTIYARDGHVFLVVAGLRFDTSSSGSGHTGPRWLTRGRSTRGCVMRHPPGL